MVVKPEHERVRTLIADTVSLLCKNGLSYTKEFSIEGLLGITLDRDDVFLVNIKEIVKTDIGKDDSNDDSDGSSNQTSQSRKVKRRKRRKSMQSEESDDSDNDSVAQANTNNGEPSAKSIKQEQEEEEDSGDDLVFVKDEPSQLPSFSSANFLSGASIIQDSSSSILGDMSQSNSMMFGTPVSDPLQTSTWDPLQQQQQQQQQQQHHPSQQSPNIFPTSSHLANTSAVSTPGQQQFPCRECGKSFRQRRYLTQHLAVHRPPRFRCDKCGNTFHFGVSLREHQKKDCRTSSSSSSYGKTADVSNWVQASNVQQT